MRSADILLPTLPLTTAMNIWYKGFIPRSESRVVFVGAMLCYEVFIGQAMSGLVKSFHLWPVVLDPVTHTRRATNPGVDGVGIVAFVVMPIIESMILVGVIQLLSYTKLKSIFQVTASALLFSILHSLQFPVWGLLVFPLFVIDAATFVYWRSSSVLLAGVMVTVLHLLSNAVPSLYILARQMHL